MVVIRATPAFQQQRKQLLRGDLGVGADDHICWFN